MDTKPQGGTRDVHSQRNGWRKNTTRKSSRLLPSHFRSSGASQDVSVRQTLVLVASRSKGRRGFLQIMRTLSGVQAFTRKAAGLGAHYARSRTTLGKRRHGLLRPVPRDQRIQLHPSDHLSYDGHGPRHSHSNGRHS